MLKHSIFPMFLACAVFPLNASDVIASGTGFAVSPEGHVLTNAHVVSGCSRVTARIGGLELSAQTVSLDFQNDLALLRISGTFSVVLPLREGARVQLGETVVAFGYPLQGVISTSLNMTTGNISALAGLGDDARSLQFTAPIQPGNSGGPLVDASGNVVGIVTSKLSPLWAAKNIGDVPQNVNFALKASVIRDFLESRGIGYQAKGLAATIPITDLPGLVSGAVFPLQCIGRDEANDTRSSAASRVGSPAAVEKRPGVLFAGYGSPATSFQFVFLELENGLTADGVQIANKPSAMQQVNGDSVSIQNLLNIAQRQGSDSLLYLTIEHGSLPTNHYARLQCFDVSGKLLWEEKASSIGHWAPTDHAAANAVGDQLKKKLKAHAGKPGLPLR
ncbi:MAG: serine protease [Bryobacteraceae bacterium]